MDSESIKYRRTGLFWSVVFPLAIFVTSLVIFLVSSGPQEFISFQSRFALFAQDMFRSGVHFFPTIYSHFYPDYTSATTFFIYLFSLLSGHVSHIAAVLPTAIASALIMIFTYKIVAPRSLRWGIIAILFLPFSLTFLIEARSISQDQFISLLAVIGFYLCYSRDYYGKNIQDAVLLIILVAGFIVRGPIGFIIPAAVIFSYLLVERNYKKSVRFSVQSSILLIICSLLLLLAAFQAGGMELVHQVITMEVTGRLGQDDSYSFLFYVSHAPGDYALTYIVGILAIIAYISSYRRVYSNPELKLLLHFTAWTIIIILGMSFPSIKKTRYILATVPPLSLLAAYLFVPKEQPILARLFRCGLYRFFVVMPGLLLIAISIIYYYGLDHNPALIAELHSALIYVFFGLLLLQCLVIAFISLKLTHSNKEIGVIAVALISFLQVYIMIAEPATQYLNRAKAFVTQVELKRESSPGPLFFYNITHDGAAVKYYVNTPHVIKSGFIFSPGDINKVPAGAYIIFDQKGFDQLPAPLKEQFHIVARGNFGHLDGVAARYQRSILPYSP